MSLLIQMLFITHSVRILRLVGFSPRTIWNCAYTSLSCSLIEHLYISLCPFKFPPFSCPLFQGRVQCRSSSICPKSVSVSFCSLHRAFL